MDKQPRMTNEEAIEVIKKNYPPENYTMLREALNIAIETLGKVDPIPLPTIKQGDIVAHAMYGIGKIEYKGKHMSAVLFEENGGRSHVSLDVFNDSLELIPNE